MTKLAWDAPGTRKFQAGVDRGVLYYYDRKTGTQIGVPWNGLISVSDSNTVTIDTPVYIDGVKVLERRKPGEYEGKLTAFTYPVEFERFDGLATSDNGIGFYDQEAIDSFGLSYRTKIGSDTAGENLGYKIHLLYGLRAKSDGQNSNTISDSTTPETFSWSLTATPKVFDGYRPTSHVVIDTTKVSAGLIAQVETMIYGTDTTVARLPRRYELNSWG